MRNYHPTLPSSSSKSFEELWNHASFGKYITKEQFPGIKALSQKGYGYLSFFDRKFKPTVLLFVDMYFAYGIEPFQILDLIEPHVPKCDIDSEIVIEHHVLENEGNLFLHKIDVVECFNWTAGKEEDYHIWDTMLIVGPKNEHR